MPRYFFDVIHGEHTSIDDQGSELPAFEAARREAIALLPQIASYELPDGEQRSFVSTVRDEAGAVLYEATLIFHGKRFD